MTSCAPPLSGASLAVPGVRRDSPGPDGRALDRARARLAARLTMAAAPDGLLRAPCDSRLLESALALRLLTAVGVDPAAQDRLVRRLKTGVDEGAPDPFQEAVARAALGEYADGATALGRLLGGFAHFTAGRKLLTFRTVLTELGAHPHTPLDDPTAAFDAGDQQRWLITEMTALKVLHCFRAGLPGLVTEEDWWTLAPSARPGPPPYANHLARLLALLALRHSPRHAEAVRERAGEVRRWLRPDGGVPYITGLDVFATATGGLALTGAGAPAHTLVVLADALTGQQNADGGWGFDRSVAQSDVDDTAYCVEFLRTVAHRARDERPALGRAVDRGEGYLLARRNADGGLPTFERGTDSETAMTAAALHALAPRPDLGPVVAEAMRFLLDREAAGGPYERSWSLNESNALFRVVLAHDSFRAAAPPGHPALPGSARARARAVARLVSTQLPDGGWGHVPGEPADPISTAYALIALARTPATADPARRAVRYLLERQRPDGGFDSRPDQAGPRPLAYHVPLLTDVCVLLGLNHAAAAGHRVVRPIEET
ncbi:MULTISPECIES: prenyltransferase/squalene oxidase repeat-containing protein [Streptomyces]|uniref:Prenyltransferase/squalene oxidase repeat-containing protein n=2 Tax=Streptomyces TaxID=1883 RepID=A0ABU4KHW0_9ACTN|nr:prenyltransferase/squalene oxidase repeat-containing protein [Streptomyces roseolus]MDX2297341.1 prenyltransferase/squalene oxidase repeat-containing protein [Streptomyces roseolus]